MRYTTNLMDHVVYLGLGTNVGVRKENLQAAINPFMARQNALYTPCFGARGMSAKEKSINAGEEIDKDADFSEFLS